MSADADTAFLTSFQSSLTASPRQAVGWAESPTGGAH